jgi:hypothetical protein
VVDQQTEAKTGGAAPDRPAPAIPDGDFRHHDGSSAAPRPDSALIKIEPTNTMMKKANWMSDGTTSDLYIIPADEDEVFGVKIRYVDPDD